MSASREKRNRQGQAGQSSSEKKQEGNNGRLLNIFYAVIAAAVVIAAIALVVWNSNFFQNRSAAVTINGEKFAPADVQFYYTSARQSEYMMSMYGYSTYDYATPAKDQVYNEADGTTWHDYFLDTAISELTQDAALAAEAKKAGYTMSASAKADVEDTMASLTSSYISSGYSSLESYLHAVYGSTMSVAKYQEILERSALAYDYSSAQQASYTYDDAALDSYYEEHTDDLDTVQYSQFIFQVNLATTDEDGNTIERTDEELSDEMEQEKAKAKAEAEEVLAMLEDGEDAEDIAEKLTDSEYLYTNDASATRTGAALNANYSEWALDPARRDGDTTLVEYAGGSDTIYNYCAVRFEGRYQDNAPAGNVRHILVGAGSDPTDEQFEQAKTEAEALLEQWKAGEATEESFAALARENSADTGSAANGGLITGITEESSYVDTFKDWALDPARKSGDTGIVQNTGSSIQGYHVMYFVNSDPAWKSSVTSILRSQDYQQWFSALLEGYTAENGSGLQYVG